MMHPDLLLVSVWFGTVLVIKLTKMVKYVQWQNLKFCKKKHATS